MHCRSDSSKGLVFGAGEGHHALYSRDLHVDAHSVLQFNVSGCHLWFWTEHWRSLESCRLAEEEWRCDWRCKSKSTQVLEGNKNDVRMMDGCERRVMAGWKVKRVGWGLKLKIKDKRKHESGLPALCMIKQIDHWLYKKTLNGAHNIMPNKVKQIRCYKKLCVLLQWLFSIKSWNSLFFKLSAYRMDPLPWKCCPLRVAVSFHSVNTVAHVVMRFSCVIL